MNTAENYTMEQLNEIVKAYHEKVFTLKKRQDTNQAQNRKKKEVCPEYNKAYYEAHKADTVICPVCNICLKRYAFTAHRNSKRHLLIQGFKQTVCDIGGHANLTPVLV